MNFLTKGRVFALTGLASAVLLAGPALADDKARLSRSVTVMADPADVWAAVGSYCAIGDWHPAIASCNLDGKATPTRTLVTKDGAKFVELQLGYSNTARRYSYTFTSAPVPVTGYASTFSVRPSGHHISIVTWSGAYTPNPGQAAAANAALAGIYESGLAAIQQQFAKAR